MKKTEKIKLLTTAGLCLALVATTFTGCGKKSASAAAVEKSLFKIKVGKTASATFLSPLIQLAWEKGYLDDYGLDLDIQKIDRIAAFDSVELGKLDTVYFELIPELSKGAQGGKIKVLAGTQSGGMAVAANHEVAEEVRDINNWKGKIIATKLISTSEMIVKDTLRNEYGLIAGKDYTLKLLEGDESILAAIHQGGKKGGADIGFIGATAVETAINQGEDYLFPETHLRKDYVCCRQTFNQKNVDSNRDKFVGYLKGQIRAYKDYVTDRDGSIDALVRSTGQSVDYVTSFIYDRESSQDTRYNPDPNYNGVAGVYDVLLESKYVETDRPLCEFYDISIYADALRQVIQEFPDDNFYKDMWTYFKENNGKFPEFDQKFSL
ncbi:MAG: ABC transporter substrate-binding protein [Treponema sp.]|nr:ABC transporter substrate-binding protein [Treponema sp.]